MKMHQVAQRAFAVALPLAVFGLSLAAPDRLAQAAVFDGPPAPYAMPLADPPPALTAEGRLLRRLSVEERSGAARRGDLVRVPVFFADHECPDLGELAILPEPNDGQSPPVVWQADDIRRGPDGGVSRVHLWFAIDLKPGEKRRFQLVRRDRPAAFANVPSITAEGNLLRVTTDRGTVDFGTDGTIRSLHATGGMWDFGDAGAFPRIVIGFPATPANPARSVALGQTTPAHAVEWGDGPLFAKIRVRLSGAGGVSLQQDYRVPRNGREIVITAAVFPGDDASALVKDNRLLVGERPFADGTPTEIVRAPAGIRYPLRAEHAYTVSALARSRGQPALLAVPLVLGGMNGQWRLEPDGSVSLQGQRGLRRGDEGEKETLRAFWTEVRLVPTTAVTPDELWQAYREQVQPLVAVVDEPGASPEVLHAALSEVVRQMKPIGWRQEAGRALVLGNGQLTKILRSVPAVKEGDVAYLLRGAKNSTAKITNHGARKLREDEKGRGYGGLDPYHVTYTQSAAAAVAVLSEAPPAVTAVNLAMARGVREFGGRCDDSGFPYVDCFNRTLNMQLGPVLFGLTAGAAAGDTALVRFYRDLATAPVVLGVFGRGQRPYPGAAATSPDQTDFLYQAICDFWLRSTELLANEHLALHPLAYSRYTDCIDVMADCYHGVGPRDKPGAAGEVRANFFRGQAHTHRWLGWSCAPFIRLLEDPSERGAVGVTEAIRYARNQIGRWKNWPDLTFYILADVLTREGLSRAARPQVPTAPQNIGVRRTATGAELSWAAVAGAAEYRVYRARAAGGPWRWLNSPYVAHPAAPLVGTAFHDPDAPADCHYMVLAVDAAGRASDWPASP